jgi:hypothetical protein
MKSNLLFAVMLGGMSLLFGTGCTVQGGFVTDRPADVIYARPVAPGDDYIWIDGDWIWEGGTYRWHEGHWDHRRAGRAWHRGNWESHGGGWRWHRGYWK